MFFGLKGKTMAWIIQHPNGEYIRSRRHGYIDTTPYLHHAKQYNRRVMRDMINSFVPGWTAINTESGKTYKRSGDVLIGVDGSVRLTVSPRTKRILIEQYGLSESDFISFD